MSVVKGRRISSRSTHSIARATTIYCQWLPPQLQKGTNQGTSGRVLGIESALFKSAA